jgi:hypothetical protein
VFFTRQVERDYVLFGSVKRNSITYVRKEGKNIKPSKYAVLVIHRE